MISTELVSAIAAFASFLVAAYVAQRSRRTFQSQRIDRRCDQIANLAAALVSNANAAKGSKPTAAGMAQRNSSSATFSSSTFLLRLELNPEDQHDNAILQLIDSSVNYSNFQISAFENAVKEYLTKSRLRADYISEHLFGDGTW